ncbi:unnamed protein product, partial [marine sediment metagenome]
RTNNIIKFYLNLERKIKEQPYLILIFISAFILLGCYINTKYNFPYFIVKYNYFLLAFVHILIARSLIILNSDKVSNFFIGILILTSFLTTSNYYIIETKSDWKSATEVIKLNIKENDIIAYGHSDNIVPFLFYYPNEPFNYSNINTPIFDFVSMKRYEEKIIRDYPKPSNESLIILKQKLKETNGGVWVIQYYAPDLRQYFDEFAEENFNLHYQKSFDNKNLLVLSYYTL